MYSIFIRILNIIAYLCKLFVYITCYINTIWKYDRYICTYTLKVDIYIFLKNSK